MSVAETLLVYVAAPLLVTAVLAAWTLRPDKASRRSRYRPGQPWEHEPVWYAPHTEQPVDGHAAGSAAGDGADTAGQPHGRTGALGSSVFGEVQGGPAAGGPHMSADAGAREGGAVHGDGSRGSTAITAGAPVRGRGGPLGGARGTW